MPKDKVKLPQVHVPIKPKEYEALQKIAESSDRSIAAQVRLYIRNGLAAETVNVASR